MSGLVVDASAILAILANEPEKDRFVDAILAASPRFMSSVSVQDAGMALAARTGGDAAWEMLDALLTHLGIEVVAHDSTLAQAGREAFLRPGAGRLSLAECAAYALAKTNGLPLLSKVEAFEAGDLSV